MAAIVIDRAVSWDQGLSWLRGCVLIPSVTDDLRYDDHGRTLCLLHKAAANDEAELEWELDNAKRRHRLTTKATRRRPSDFDFKTRLICRLG